MSKFDPSAHIPKSNMSAYIGSTPKDPIAIIAVKEFAKGVPSISQPADMTTVQLKAEARAVIKHLDTQLPRMEELSEAFDLRWREFGPTRDLACNEMFGCSLDAMRHKVKRWKDKLVSYGLANLTAEEDKKNTQSMVLALPDPLAEPPNPKATLPTDEELLGVPATVHAGPAPMADRVPQAAPKAPDVPRDLIGFPIPSVLLERWGQRQEVQDRITAASRLRCALEEIANKGHQNPLYGLYDWQGMIRTISQLQFHLGQCKPEVVCYECDGRFEKLKPTKGGGGITRHCHACDDRGFMVQKQWADYADTKLAVIKEKVEARLAKCK